MSEHVTTFNESVKPCVHVTYIDEYQYLIKNNMEVIPHFWAHA